jgi:hypothetical protein
MQAASSQTGGTGSAAGGAPVSELEAVRKKIKLGQASIQLQLAALMLALAEQSKNSAMQYISAIEATHEESAQVAELLNEARTSQSKAGKDKDATGMSVKMQDYFKKHGLAYDMANNDTYHYKEQWNVAIESLKARQDQLGTDTQQKMVFVQDFMGQYNSYLSGANDSIKQAVQLLRELAKS